jgi:NAD(P)-dependent dehydrogenase (short-subunit alcohol dehydrogenase family)
MCFIRKGNWEPRRGLARLSQKEDTIKLQRPSRPADVANVVVFFASLLSDYVNGANYRVDGDSNVSVN